MRRLLIAAILLAGAAPVLAQSDGTVLRVDRLEKEMKAVQRKVFPNGVAIEPEIAAAAAGASPAGNLASAPISDLTGRVDALENQLKALTGQVETDGFRLKKLEDAMKLYEGRLKALEPPVAADAPAPGGAGGPALAAATPAKPAPAAKPATTPAKAAAAPGPIKVDPARKAAIAAVEEILKERSVATK